MLKVVAKGLRSITCLPKWLMGMPFKIMIRNAALNVSHNKRNVTFVTLLLFGL